MSTNNKTKINIDNLTAKELAEYNRLLYENKIFEIKNDRNLFTEYVLRDRISKKKVKQSKIHKAMQYAFEHYKKVLVVVPRNSGKTNQSLAAMLYEIGKNNDIIIKIVSDGDNTASKRVNAIKQHLEHNDDFLELYPNIKPLTLGNRSLARENWGKTSLTIQREIIDLNATCLAGDSLVNMPCNREKKPNGIKIKDLVGEENFPVYSYDIKKKIVAVGNCSGVWEVGKRKVYKVTYEWVTYSGKKSNSVVVTEDHKFLLRDGQTYKQTNELKIKDSLMPFSLSYGGLKAERPVIAMGDGREVLEHRLVCGVLDDKSVIVHHIDGNKLNNSKDNLMVMTNKEHARMHSTGRKLSMSTRKRMSKYFMGRKISEETKEKLSKANKGKIISKETRRKISDSLKEHHKNNVNPLIGRKLSPIHIENIKNGSLGRKQTEETRRKISLANKGRKFSLEIRKKMSEAHKGQCTPKQLIALKKLHNRPNPFLGKNHSQQTKDAISKTKKAKLNNPYNYYVYLKKYQKKYGTSDAKLQKTFFKRFPESQFPPINQAENHKIKSIEYVGIETVYDLSIDKYENVAINGIIVHNCSASSITTQGVGDRADLLVFDDPCNLRNSILMPALREQVIDAYYSVWLPLLNESGRVWYFGTPYSSDDLTSLLREKWKDEPDCCILDFHLGQEIEIDQEGKVIKVIETGDDTLPIWPENFSKEFYMSAKRTMTDKAYARAYLCKAISDSDVFFKMSHVQACLDYSFSLLENINELEEVE